MAPIGKAFLCDCGVFLGLLQEHRKQSYKVGILTGVVILQIENKSAHGFYLMISTGITRSHLCLLKIFSLGYKSRDIECSGELHQHYHKHAEKLVKIGQLLSFN